MKKLLFLIPFLFVGSLRADSVTSGNVGLLLPSTGTTDTTRRLDDKYNFNYGVIASTLNTTISDINTLESDVTTLGIDTGTIHDTFYAYTATASASGGSAAVSTESIRYGGYLMLSTYSLTGIPGAYLTPGRSTWTVTALSAYCAEASTVAITGLQLVVSTSGLRSFHDVPVHKRFPRVDIPTATTNGYAGYSINIATELVVNSGEWIGLQITTVPISGKMSKGVEVQIAIERD